jgi:hypothetical protein
VDALVEFANQQGLVLAMLPTWGYYVSDVPAIDAARAARLRPVARSAVPSAPNVIWVNGGDRVPTGFEERLPRAGPRAARGRRRRPSHHLSPCGWRSSSQFFHKEDWLDFDMIETWTEWAKIHPAVLADALLSPRKPVVLGEGAYEDGPEYPQGPITPSSSAGRPGGR